MRRVARPREIATTDPAEIPACVAGRLCSVWLPIDTGSPANERGATRWRGARDAAIRSKTAHLVLRAIRLHRVTVPCTVVLVRVSPRALDSDNAASAMKRVRDGVADALAIDDADPRVTWVVEQRRGEKRQRGVIVEFYPRGLAWRALLARGAEWCEDNAAALDAVLPLLRERV